VLWPQNLVIADLRAPADAARNPADAVALVRELLSAGADHVILMAHPGGGFAVRADLLDRLAPALTVTMMAGIDGYPGEPK
jgi:hypothetical protein